MQSDSKETVREAFFWKHLADTLLEHYSIDKKAFYTRVRKVKSVWDIKDLDGISDDVLEAARGKEKYVKKNFAKILTEIENMR
ncbi:MAG TPA: hypothetical protein VI564_09420 [Candidatus Nanoarchaeia archaeon]|nr:hypothetical protein [Candidatus Nanoarchaeia archaeon]